MVTAADKKLKGRYVRFLIRDIHLPAPTSVLHELHEADELRGKVIDFSDSGNAGEGAFAVVRVAHLRRPCIVSIDRLRHGKKAEVAR